MTAEEFKSIRLQGGYTQVEYARKLGISQPYVAQIEWAKRPVTKRLLDRIKRIGFRRDGDHE